LALSKEAFKIKGCLVLAMSAFRFFGEIQEVLFSLDYARARHKGQGQIIGNF